jgi:pilus assembly protein CpaE
MAEAITTFLVQAGAFTRAPLVCILGPKGGTGKTLTATSFSVALAEYGKSVALVDLDLQFGDIGLTMGLTPEQTIFDLVRVGGSLCAEELDGFLMAHSSGVKVLIAPSRPDPAAVVSVDFLSQVYSTLRSMFDFVVVDTPPRFAPEVIATIDNATDVIMVGMLDALSLKNTRLGLETLDLMGFPAENVKLVLNRARGQVGVSEEEVVEIMGREPDIFVPSDRDIPRAVNEGKPILIAKPQAEASVAYRLLAASYLLAPQGDRSGALRMHPEESGHLDAGKTEAHHPGTRSEGAGEDPLPAPLPELARDVRPFKVPSGLPEEVAIN